MNGEEETKEVRSVWMTDEEIKILLDLLEDSKYHNKEMFDCEVELCSTLYSVPASFISSSVLPTAATSGQV